MDEFVLKEEDAAKVRKEDTSNIILERGYREQCQGKSAVERNLLKATVLSQRTIPPYAANGFTITISSLSLEGLMLKVIASAIQGGNPVSVNNPLYFLNPPILVPDGTTRLVTDRYGITERLPNFKEDLDEAIRQMVAEVIRVQNP
jgi:hypothetical protein